MSKVRTPIIKGDDVVTSVADALQYISYYHPPDFLKALAQAHADEQSPAAKDALAQILVNSRLCAQGHRPICQDTGIVVAFIKVGMNVAWDTDRPIHELVDAGVRQAYTDRDNPLRASIVSDPAGLRKNTGDNTPAVTHIEMIPGNRVEITVAAKGGGSENKATFAMLNPSDSVADWVMSVVPHMGAGWCPPGMLGIGIGGTAEKAMVLAKEALMEPIDIQELIKRGAKSKLEELRLEIFQKVNALGIGAQGLGGLTTVVDVKVRDYPTHATSKPVALIPNCAATRHVHFTLDGSGPAHLPVPNLDDWPKIAWAAGPQSQRINLDQVTAGETQSWKPGDTLLLSGKLLTGRDVAHRRIAELINRGEALPNGVDLRGRFIYYVGPVDAVRGEAVGPAGPTTATRMDRYTELLLSKTGLLGMIGKAERGPEAIAAIKKHKSVYLVATGGAAYLISKAIKKSRVVAFPELGMEAIYEFEVQDMPVTVAVDSQGQSIHDIGPALWRGKRIAIPIVRG